ncbi:molybdopterin oxidoreductase family protein [Anaeroarcus burkinensis]|uniref:molybdopterin-containing oxidoreductase family protein n=1 Tax=Anaeroarcus burkinensis TaxID=82376 RepID=UPI000410A6D2
MMQAYKRSVCPYDCPDACSLLVKVENGRAIEVVGEPQHPITQGKLCFKMRDYPATVYSPERILTPLRRTGAKGSGAFTPISWEEAIASIAEQWRGLVAQYGGEAILPFSYAGTMGVVQRNAGHAFFHRLGASQLERTLCSPAKDYGWRAIMGGTKGMRVQETAHSDLIVIWGANAAATSVHFLHFVQQAKKKGAKVWLIDTYETPTAAVADRVIRLQPGSDAALALGLVRLLDEEGLSDEAFLEEHVQGYEKLRQETLPDYTAEKVAALTGVTPQEQLELAQALGRAKAPLIRMGSGMTRYGNGAMTIRAILCVPAWLGAWRHLGGGAYGDLSTGAAVDKDVVLRPDLLNPATRSININQLGDALTKMEPPVRSLYVYHCNPAAVVADQNKVLAGLRRDDLFTVVHERFLTDTALFADIVLPATTSLEQDDLFTCYGHYFVQRSPAAIDPVGEAKSNWDVFRLLAEAMGFADLYEKTAVQMVDAVLERPTPWLEAAGVEKIRQGEFTELPLPAEYKLQYFTPSGKIEVWNPLEQEPLPRWLPPHSDEGDLWLMTAPSVYGLNSSFSEQPRLMQLRGKMSLLMHPADAAKRKLQDGMLVEAWNERGKVLFTLAVTDKAQPGVVVAEGVWKLADAPGSNTVNALTSQRLTDRAAGSTFYDTKVFVRQGM